MLCPPLSGEAHARLTAVAVFDETASATGAEGKTAGTAVKTDDCHGPLPMLFRAAT